MLVPHLPITACLREDLGILMPVEVNVRRVTTAKWTTLTWPTCDCGGCAMAALVLRSDMLFESSSINWQAKLLIAWYDDNDDA